MNELNIIYYCISCKEFHEELIRQERIFKTGYTLVDEGFVPLGACMKKECLQEESNRTSEM